MTGPKITSTENGIVLNKTLAWAILVAVLSGGMWVGTTVSNLTGVTKTLASELARASSERASLEARIRIVEAQAVRAETQMAGAVGAIQSLRGDVGELNRMTRQILARLGLSGD